jgi:hypothetical protein
VRRATAAPSMWVERRASEGRERRAARPALPSQIGLLFLAFESTGGFSALDREPTLAVRLETTWEACTRIAMLPTVWCATGNRPSSAARYGHCRISAAEFSDREKLQMLDIHY